jgi:hypothetical protein
VAEEASHISQTICLEPVDGIVSSAKQLLKQVCPKPVDFGKSFSYQAVKFLKGVALRTTLHNHARQLGLHAGGQLQLHQLVACFFGVNAALYREIDGSPQIDQVGVALILDFQRALLLLILILGTLVLVVVLVFLGSTALTQDFSFQVLVQLFGFFKVCIIFEYVEAVECFEFSIKIHTMCYHVLLFKNIELILDTRVVAENIFPDLE